MRYHSFILLFIGFVYSSSAQKPFYSKNVKGWEEKKIPEKAVVYSVYLLGALGDEKDSSHLILEMLQSQTAGSDTNYSIIFLSDKIYKNGLPAENEADRIKAEQFIDTQLSYFTDIKKNIFFIAGQHHIPGDEGSQLSSILRTQQYIEKKLGRKNIFQPANGCPGPVEISLTKDLILIPINTQWWLSDKDEKNNDCENKNVLEWTNELKDIVDNNQRKNILILGHHPLLNAGNHGGYFSMKQHIFPLTDLQPNLYLPLPVVGSLYPLYRAGIGSEYDLAYPPYKKLRKNIFLATRDYDNVIYASAHEHNLQHLRQKNQDFIVTNSSGDVSWAGKNRKTYFSYAEKGLVKLNFLKNGEAWMEVFVSSEESKKGKAVYLAQLKANPVADNSDSTLIDAKIPVADSVITVAADKTLDASRFKKLFFGEHYREAWTTPVRTPLIDLRHDHGGFEILKKGGGLQTQSLRLRNPRGEEFALRSVVKYPHRILGWVMENTLVADVVKDQTSSTHPYGAYIVDDLSEAAGILHSYPKMVYIPNDILLREYRKDFANTLALLEQRPDGNLAPSANFGYVKESISTEKMIKNLHEDNANGYDERKFLKSRLFDIWINDWDRHDGQWRWGEVECNETNRDECGKLKAKKQYYIPIPRDRDYAFAKYEGFFPWLAGRKWIARKFQNFDTDIRDVPGLVFNARNLDRALLTELSFDEWKEVAGELQNNLTNDNIEHSVRQLPDELYEIDGAEIIGKLKIRRDKLTEFAEKYYLFLAKDVDIVGSDKKEIFAIDRLNDDSTSVKVFDNQNNGNERLYYSRTFKTDETKEIRIYCMGGDDMVTVSGNTNRGILVRIIGGDGNDSITDVSHVSGWSKKTRIYDNKSRNPLKLEGEAKDLTSDSKTVNDYNYKYYEYNLLAPAAFFGYNTDDGIFLGGGVAIRRHGFRKKPYSSYQRIVANTSLNQGAFNFKYKGDFNNIFGKWGINIDFSVLAPKSSTNFFGLGNETPMQFSKTYYRYRYDEINVFTALKRQLGKFHSMKIGPAYKYIKVENTPGRFITSAEGQSYLNDFKARHFYGGRFEYEVQNIDDTVLTLRGIRWTASVTSIRNSENSLHPTNFESQISVYIPFPNNSTLALRAGGATLAGDFEFYQANILGAFNIERGNGNLRGYLRGRYSGRTTAYLNADLRIRLIGFKTYLFPAHFGILGFYDRGKVWTDNEESSVWHSAYGGGLWIDPFGMTVINLTYAIAKEEKLFSLGLGFLF